MKKSSTHPSGKNKTTTNQSSSLAGKRNSPGIKDSPLNKIHSLQRIIGNKAVQRLLHVQKADRLSDQVIKDTTGVTIVQRAGDPTQAPPMKCELATSTPTSIVQEILFAQNKDVVSASDVFTLRHLAVGWASGGSPMVRIDGYTSIEGSQPHNWALSCRRAEAIKSILTRTPRGIPANRIRIVAHGEGEEAGVKRSANRRATVILQFPTTAPNPTPRNRICGPDITSSLTTMLGTVGPWFRSLTTFQKRRSCVALGPGAPFVGVNPIMAWDTRQLFLPNTGWLDIYFRRRSCGSPRNAGCATDPRRHLCETAGTCGNSVVVGGKCMLAGTANYALFGKMCRLCHDETSQWGRWDMRAIIEAYKMIGQDDSTPPKEVASAAYDGTFPTMPAATENRKSCTGRCGLTHGGAFNFIWEPYKSR
jgi:outer membrane protein OmpA-like peptidoglycan-associated protein